VTSRALGHDRRGRVLAALRRRRVLEQRQSALLELDPAAAERVGSGGGVPNAPAPPGGRSRAQARARSRRRDRLTSIDLRMMERAILLARRAAAEGEVPVAAVIYRGGEIIAEAHNRRELHPDPTGHAEILALREAGQRLAAWRLLGCTLAVTLEPCAMCAGALVNARLERLIYGASDPKAGACESLYRITTDSRLNHRLIVHRGLYARTCSRLLARFFESRRGQTRLAPRPS